MKILQIDAGIWKKYLDNSEVPLPPGELPPDLEYGTAPILTVTEGDKRFDINDIETVEAIIQLTNAVPAVGKLSVIKIFYKDVDELNWREFGDFFITDPQATITITHPIVLEKKPQTFRFGVQLLNPLNNPWKVSGSIQTLQVQAVFNGVPDLWEYVEGFELHATNTADPEGGTVESDTIKFRWKDVKSMDDAEFPKESVDAFGNPVTVTQDIRRKITGYVLYMFVSDSEEPPASPFPGVSTVFGSIPFNGAPFNYQGMVGYEPNGKWVKVYDNPGAFCEVKCPTGDNGMYVSFWLGMKTQKTITKIEENQVIY